MSEENDNKQLETTAPESEVKESKPVEKEQVIYAPGRKKQKAKKAKKEKKIILGDKQYTEEDLFSTFESDPRAASSVSVDTTIDANLDDLFKVVGTNEENIEQLDAVPYSYWRMTFSYLFKKPMAIISIVLIVLIILLAIFGPMIHSYYPLMTSHGTVLRNPNGVFTDELVGGYLAPNSKYWFGLCGSNMGTWFEGTDMWTDVWLGTRLSLVLGTVVALIEVVVGIIVGALWGYVRWLDPILIEVRNFINNIPEILLDILLMQFFTPYMSDYGFWIIVLLLSMFSWIGLAGFVRNQIIIIRNREYNIASQTMGTNTVNMITHNLLPYLISVIVTDISTAIPAAISAEVGLSFFNLSFNIADGDITLGQVLTQAVNGTAFLSHPYLLLGPFIVIIPLTVGFFYLGLALSDATDPRTHR